MGQWLSRLRRGAKQLEEVPLQPLAPAPPELESSRLSTLLRSIKWCGDFNSKVTTEPCCQSVVEGSRVEQVYGCHAHLYRTASPSSSHGTTLVWSLTQSALSALSLLSLCRVANSCRKNVVLIDEDTAQGVALTYCSEL